MMLKKLLLGSEAHLERKIYIWNIAGSMMTSAASVLLLFAVTRVLGAITAGVFSLAFSVAQMMLTVGNYEMRAYQATDIRAVYSFSDYFFSRVLTCSAMIAAGVIFAFANGYDAAKAAVVILIVAYKMFDALEDVFHGLYQQRGRLDVAGRSLFYRNFVSMLVFCIALICSKDLIQTCAIGVAACAVSFCLFNLPVYRVFYKGKFVPAKKKIFMLLWVCLPLFLGAFMLIYINNAPKYAIDTHMSEEYQAYYNYLFMPAFVINLLAAFLFKPMVTTMAEIWGSRERRRLPRVIGKLAGAVVLITAGALAAGYFFGVPALSWFYGVPLGAYRPELCVILLGGGFNAMVSLMFYSITVLRKQKLVLFSYAAALVCSLILSYQLAPVFGLMGAACAYCAAMGVLCALLAVTFVICYKKGLKQPILYA